MAFNASSVAGGRAQVLQPHSLRALLSSVYSVSGLLAVAILSFLLMHWVPWLTVVIHPRQHLLHTRAVRHVDHRIRGLATLWTVNSSFSQECGIEALLFVYYVKSLFILCGLSTLLVTPSMASFNYFVAPNPVSTDWLNRLSWTNLPTKDAKSYWLYATLLPVTIACTLYILTQNITRAIELQHQALTATVQGTRQMRKFFVVVTNIPHHWDLERVRHHYTAWKGHIDHTKRVPTHMYQRSTRLASLVRLIEQRETSFIADMVRQSGVMGDQGFHHFLLSCLEKRYACDKIRGPKWSHDRGVTISTLYRRLRELMSSDFSEDAKSTASERSVLMALDDYRWARALTDVPSYGDTSHCRAHFLGSSVANIIATNLGHHGSRMESRRNLVQILTFVLAISWTFPMAMVGGLSQISLLIQLMPGSFRPGLPDWLLGVAQGVVPSLATSALMWLFPRLLQVIMGRAGYLTHTDTQLSTQTVYFAFLFVQLFLTPSISSGLIPIALEVLDHGITEVPRILAQNLPLAGNYYLSYLLVQSVLLVTSVLLRPVAILNLLRAARGTATPREKLTFLWNLLVPVRWGELYPFYSVLAVIVLTFSLLTPVILPIATLAFGGAYMAHRYILLYLANVTVETRGRLYFPAFFHLFVGLYAQQLTFIGLFVLKFDPQNKLHDLGQLIVLVVTFLFSIQYHIHLKRRFEPSIQHCEATLDPPNCTTKSPRASSQDIANVTLPSKSDKNNPVEALLADPPGIIWLPKDGLGISRHLRDHVRAKYFAGATDVVRLVDSDANITENGRVTIVTDGASLEALPRLTS